MIAIETKYLGPTNYRPSRIKATANGHTVTVSYPHEKSQGADVHSVAALELCRRMGWTRDTYAYKGGATHLVAGGTREGWVFVFIHLDEPRPENEYNVYPLPEKAATTV